MYIGYCVLVKQMTRPYQIGIPTSCPVTLQQQSGQVTKGHIYCQNLQSCLNYI